MILPFFDSFDAPLIYTQKKAKVGSLEDRIITKLVKGRYFKRLSDEKFQTLCGVIQNIQQDFDKLRLEGHINNEQLKSLHSALALKHNLTDFTLRCYGIDNVEVNFVLEIIKSNLKLERIELYKINLGDVGIKELANYITHSKKLRSLILDKCKLTDTQIERLATAMQQNKSIQYLSLDANNVGDKGALAIAKLLGVSESLESLNLMSNKIETHGLNAILDSLQINRKLIHLNVRKNPVNYSAIKNNFIKNLECNDSLRCFNIDALEEQEMEINRTLSVTYPRCVLLRR